MFGGATPLRFLIGPCAGRMTLFCAVGSVKPDRVRRD